MSTKVTLTVVPALVGLLACGCGTVRIGFPPGTGSDALNGCLRRQGITDSEVIKRLTPEELAVPAALTFEPTPLPRNVTRVQYERALRKCGGAQYIKALDRRPVTTAVARERLLAIQQCLARNSYTVPAPNLRGPGPVFDTSGIDIAGARWQATVIGCETTAQLTQRDLTTCVGARALREPAASPRAERLLLELRRCLRTAG